MEHSELTRILTCASANARKIKRPTSKAMLLLRIAQTHAERGHLSECKQLIDEVTILCERLKQPDVSLVLCKLALCHAKSGEFEMAHSKMLKVREFFDGPVAAIEGHGILYALVETYCEIGWKEKALTLIDRLNDPLRDAIVNDILHDTVLGGVARQCLKDGDFVSALGVIERMRNGSSRASEVVELILKMSGRDALTTKEQEVITALC